MCTKEEFARLRDQTVANTKQINDLAKADAVQSEQIKTLFVTTKEQGSRQEKVVNRLLMVVICVLVLTVLALIFGALGRDGFNAVARTAPAVVGGIPGGVVPSGQ